MNRLPITIGFVCGYFVSLYKWYTFFKHNGQIQELFIWLTESFRMGFVNDVHGIWNEKLQASLRVSKLVTLSWTSWIFYITLYLTLYPLTMNGIKVEIAENHNNINEFLNDMNVTKVRNNETSSENAYNILYFLPFGDWPFLDTTSSPSYDLVYFLQMSGTIIHGLIHASADSLYFSLATLICGQFEALSLVLRDIQKSDDYSELLACIDQHQQLLRAVEMMNVIFSPLILVQFSNALFSLCTFAFEASKMKGIQIIGHAQFLFSTVVEIYIFSSVGSRLTNLSTDIADASYESDWVDKPKSWKKSVEIMIMRAQKPLQLIGGPFYVMSKETFMALIQLSFSYYTVLRNVQETAE